MARFRLDDWLARRTGLAAPTPEALRAWQMERLRELVRHALANSPFYARHLRGVDPDALRTAADLARLPLLAPTQVSAAPEALLCVSQDECARAVTVTSSGTTGEPKRFFFTAEDLAATRDFFASGMAHLLDPGGVALVLLPGERPDGVGQLLARALEDSGAGAVVHGALENTALALDEMLAEDVTCVVGSPAHVHLLARAWERRGLPGGRVASVLLCWDQVPEPLAAGVARAFGCRVFRHWGMIETGLGGAVECAPGSGLHLREAELLLEVVGPDGTPLPEGEAGELVVTTLARRGMPLLRYRTGDAGRLLPGACACGSPLRRLDPAVTRLEDGGGGGSGPTLTALNNALFAVPGLDDFAAAVVDGTLALTVCGQGPDLEANVRDAVRRAWPRTALRLDIRNDGAPAVPGLGKRRIHTGGTEA